MFWHSSHPSSVCPSSWLAGLCLDGCIGGFYRCTPGGEKQVTEKIVDCLKVFLQEGEPGIFNRDAYDALEDTYSTPELKESFAKAIDSLQMYLCNTFGLGPAKLALQVGVRVRSDRMSVTQTSYVPRARQGHRQEQ